jgi:hypothetical protein
VNTPNETGAVLAAARLIVAVWHARIGETIQGFDTCSEIEALVGAISRGKRK